MLKIQEYLKDINNDPEFKIAARHWNSTLKFVMGNTISMIRIKDGAITEFNTMPGMMEDWNFDFYVSAPEEEWEKLLEPIPKPFYQAILPAALFHGFSFGGDFESFCAYYRALSRMIELMRLHAIRKVKEH